MYIVYSVFEEICILVLRINVFKYKKLSHA